MSDTEARATLEAIRWPNGTECPNCGSRNVGVLRGTSHRAGLWKCRARECRRQFTVTVGTIFHRSKLPMLAIVLAVTRSRPLNALALQREAGLGSYTSAWNLARLAGRA